jgi:hypothetical protein
MPWIARQCSVASRLSKITAAALPLLLAGCAHHRLSAFEATLAAHDSATVALTQWCAARRLADPAQIVAAPVHGSAVPKHGLGMFIENGGSAQSVHRHVRLRCGNKVLSEAHNWYDPALLTPDMREKLASTNTPFGKVVAPLGFKRFPISTQSRRGRGDGCPPPTILTHRAVLKLPDGRPLALVVECYTSANLAG